MAAMPPFTRCNWKLYAGIFLFVVGQAFSIAHAAEYGSEPHEHNGVACLAVLHDELDDDVPAGGLAAPQVYGTTACGMQDASPSSVRHTYALQPPATGPPLQSNF